MLLAKCRESSVKKIRTLYCRFFQVLFAGWGTWGTFKSWTESEILLFKRVFFTGSAGDVSRLLQPLVDPPS